MPEMVSRVAHDTLQDRRRRGCCPLRTPARPGSSLGRSRKRSDNRGEAKMKAKMISPVERLQQFMAAEVEKQEPREIEEIEKQKKRETPAGVWGGKISDCIGAVNDVLEAFSAGLHPEYRTGPPVQVENVGGKALRVSFSPRSCGQPHGTPEGGAAIDFERGAFVAFYVDEVGSVRGVRSPFVREGGYALDEEFVNLGDPAQFDSTAVASAVVDFLEWAAVGGGCGAQKLQFVRKPQTVKPRPEQVR
jgi:hypothetical protein